MDALVIYDSLYGNTGQIALAIGKALDPLESVNVLRVTEVKPDQLASPKLLVIGSPTQRFRPTTAISDLLKGLSKNRLLGVKVAAFDTRLTLEEINATPVLAFFVRIYGYAAKPVARHLERKGGQLIVPPQGFYVAGMEGPLVLGELERAADWARQILAKIQ